MPADAPAQAPLPVVRETVRQLLLSSAAYRDLDSGKRRELAQSLVKVCDTAVALLEEEARTASPKRRRSKR